VGNGLIPCGNPGQESCQACHVVELISNLVSWLIGLLSIVAAVMFVIAGSKILTAGDNPEAIKNAKGMFVNVLIGAALVLSAWLIVDTVLKNVLVRDLPWGPWHAIQCFEQPEATTVAGSIRFLAKREEGVEKCVSTDDCAAKAAACAGVSTVDGEPGDLYVTCTTWDGGVGPEPFDAGDCSPANLEKHGFTPEQAVVMSCIAGPESGCNNNADASDNGLKSSARGVFQIVFGWDDRCHSLRLPECTKANGGKELNCDASDDVEGSACNRAASNFKCNAAAALCLLNGAEGVKPGYHHWLADHRATKQAACVDKWGN